jgi:fido (protein-threonine AMPylation protein)
MGLDLDYINGQTPLDEEEKDGLLILTIATRGELDEFEQQNIEKAVQWILERTFKPEFFSLKTLSECCINGCMPMYGHGQVSSGKPTRT